MRVLFYIILAIIPSANLCHPRPADGDFNIVFQQTFESTPLGPYNRKQWKKDWSNPPWANGISSGDMSYIIELDSGEKDTRAMKWIFPKGTYGANSSHGYQWRTSLGGQFEEIYLSYSIMFKPGFEPVLGGKLPGLQASPIEIGPKRWEEGFGGSLMFKEGPKPVFYIYHHDQKGEYGDTKEWEYVFDVSSETWYNITFRVVMNTATAKDIGGPDGENDGILEGYVNGKLVGQWTGLRLRNLASIGTDVVRIQGFFGGNTDNWATKRDEWILIDNVYVWNYSEQFLHNHPEVKRGKQANNRNVELHTPIDVLKKVESF